MSLTEELSSANSPLGSLFRSTFETRAVLKEVRDRLASAQVVDTQGMQPQDYSLVGTAIDYRIRFYLKPTGTPGLLAFKGIFSHPHRDKLPEFFGRHFLDGVLEYFAHLNRFIRETRPWERALRQTGEAQLNRHCLVMARLDAIYRGWPMIIFSRPKTLAFYKTFSKVPDLGRYRMVSELSKSFPEYLLFDMGRLSSLFAERCTSWLKSKNVALNPTFTLSGAVGGADGDVILNHTYFELKATKRTPKGVDLFQILAYPLLDLPNKYGLQRVGFYLVRRGAEFTWDIEDLFGKMRKTTLRLTQFKREFLNAVRETEVRRREKLRDAIAQLRNA